MENRTVRTVVKSSHLYSIGYDASTLTLDVQFLDKHGKPNPNSIYRYLPVPLRVYQMLMNSDSKGSYLAKNIIPDRTIKVTKIVDLQM